MTRRGERGDGREQIKTLVFQAASFSSLFFPLRFLSYVFLTSMSFYVSGCLKPHAHAHTHSHTALHIRVRAVLFNLWFAHH